MAMKVGKDGMATITVKVPPEYRYLFDEAIKKMSGLNGSPSQEAKTEFMKAILPDAYTQVCSYRGDTGESRLAHWRRLLNLDI